MLHVKVKTEYSFGQTYAPIDRIVKALVEIKEKSNDELAAAIVDDNTWGHVKFHKACRKAGIRPILGVECIVSDSDDDERKMWFLTRNAEGLKRLYRAMSKAHTQPIVNKWGRKPRLKRSDVVEMSMHGDVVVFAGEVTDGPFLKEIGAVLDLSPYSQVLSRKKSNMAIDSGFDMMLVRVGSMNYVYPEDREVFEKVCPSDIRPGEQHMTLSHFSSIDDDGDLFEDYDMPKANMIEVPNAKGILKRMCNEGLAKRGIRPLKKLTKYIDRMNYELDIIHEKGFDSYFVVVADMCQYAKQHMLVGPSRGSAAGSLVCYLTGITEIDPIPAKLMFERFIDITRSDFPDIDLDFPDNKRKMVFEYMQEKYKNVAHIGTVLKFKPSLALNHVCRQMGIPQHEASGVKDAMIERASGDERENKCLEDTFLSTDAGKIFSERHPVAASVAAAIEGHASHTGVHAAGLIVSSEDISQYAVIDANDIAHIDMDDVTNLGLLKIDILGLRTLSILEDIPFPIDWYNLPLDDEKTFEVFNSGKLCGVFQFEGRAVRQVASRMNIKSIEDLQDIVSLARPGPMQAGIVDRYIDRMSGVVEVRPIHKDVDRILQDTYGLPIYQENTMALVREVAGFDWSDTGKVRKAVSKKKTSEIKAFEDKFIQGAISHGVDPDDAEWLWGMLVTMGTYQFNLSHARSYAVIAYWTAWLKANYPMEFAAATLRNARDTDSAMAFLRELEDEGVGFVPFDPFRSELDWSVQDGQLIGGFLQLHGAGDVKARKLIQTRSAVECRKFKPVFADIWPMSTRYSHLYLNEGEQYVNGTVYKLSQIEEGDVPHGAERVFIARIDDITQKDYNDPDQLAKRGGVRKTGKTKFIDLKLSDDSSDIRGRITGRSYSEISSGVLLMPVGAHVLVRAVFLGGKRFAFINKIKRIDS